MRVVPKGNGGILMGGLVDEVAAIELLSKSRVGKIVTNQNIDYIVFYPNEPFMLVRKDGKWIKVKYEVVK